MGAFIEADAGHACNFGVNSRVVVPEEADTGLGSRNQLVESSSLAHIPCSLSVPVEPHACGRVVGEQNVDGHLLAQSADLVLGVVPLCGTLEGG